MSEIFFCAWISSFHFSLKFKDFLVTLSSVEFFRRRVQSQDQHAVLRRFLIDQSIIKSRMSFQRGEDFSYARVRSLIYFYPRPIFVVGVLIIHLQYRLLSSLIQFDLWKLIFVDKIVFDRFSNLADFFIYKMESHHSDEFQFYIWRIQFQGNRVISPGIKLFHYHIFDSIVTYSNRFFSCHHFRSRT